MKIDIDETVFLKKLPNPPDTCTKYKFLINSFDQLQLFSTSMIISFEKIDIKYLDNIFWSLKLLNKKISEITNFIKNVNGRKIIEYFNIGNQERTFYIFLEKNILPQLQGKIESISHYNEAYDFLKILNISNNSRFNKDGIKFINDQISQMKWCVTTFREWQPFCIIRKFIESINMHFYYSQDLELKNLNKIIESYIDITIDITYPDEKTHYNKYIKKILLMRNDPPSFDIVFEKKNVNKITNSNIELYSHFDDTINNFVLSRFENIIAVYNYFVHKKYKYDNGLSCIELMCIELGLIKDVKDLNSIIIDFLKEFKDICITDYLYENEYILKEYLPLLFLETKNKLITYDNIISEMEKQDRLYNEIPISFYLNVIGIIFNIGFKIMIFDSYEIKSLEMDGKKQVLIGICDKHFLCIVLKKNQIIEKIYKKVPSDPLLNLYINPKNNHIEYLTRYTRPVIIPKEKEIIRGKEEIQYK